MQMKVLSALTVALLAIGGTAQLYAGTVYLDDSAGNLYDGDPTTGVFNLIGNSGIAGGFSDIDFTSDGTLYGLDSAGNLYTINTATAAPTLVGATGVGNNELVGMAGDPFGNLYAGGAGEIFQLNTLTGAAGPSIGGGAQGYSVSGDLEFINSTLYLTSGPGTVANGGELWSVDTTTGVGTDIGNTGFAAVWGLAYDTDNGVLYGYTSGATEISINPATGAGAALFTPIAGTLVDGTTDQLLGAAFITTPEPTTFVLIGLPLAILGIARRRKAN
jgi:hypothetical protein